MSGRTLVFVSLALLTAARPGRAETPPAAPPATPPAAAEAADPFAFEIAGDGTAAGPAPAVDPIAAAKRQRDDEALERAVKLRRPMLQWHQGLGFATLGVMALTLVIGQLNYVDKYGGGVDDGRYRVAHLGLGITSSVMFAALGALGLFAPNPYPKPIRFDTALVHKIAMIMATAGMVLQIVLGPITASREGKLDQRGFAIAHTVSGYTTFAVMAAGMLAYFF